MNDPPPAMNITDIRVIGVIGAGQMGSGIAQVAAQCGYRTLLTDVSADIATRAKEKIGAILGQAGGQSQAHRRCARGDSSAGSSQRRATRLAEADFVVEAATENVELKLSILRAADTRMKKEAILASQHFVDLHHQAGRRGVASRRRSSGCTS